MPRLSARWSGSASPTWATFWTWAQRRDEGYALEALMLYQNALEAAGVTGYSWEQLFEDYTLMLRLMIFDPIHDAVAGASESYWRTKMMCLVPAYLQWCVGDDELVPGLRGRDAVPAASEQ